MNGYERRLKDYRDIENRTVLSVIDMASGIFFAYLGCRLYAVIAVFDLGDWIEIFRIMAALVF